MLGYVRGALGKTGAGALSPAALKGANFAIDDLAQGLTKSKVLVPGFGMVDGTAATTAARSLAQGSITKTLGLSGTAKLASTAKGAKFLAVRGGALAIPGLQVVAAASLLYDLGKMGGEIIKSGINLRRDAHQSLQGSINKPMFGMGYRDSEAAATSRSRGVMAIQNSRLNARSALGSEASMMAAHFG